MRKLRLINEEKAETNQKRESCDQLEQRKLTPIWQEKAETNQLRES